MAAGNSWRVARVQQIDKVFKSKDIESQLYDARLQQAALQISEEKEKHLQDKQLVSAAMCVYGVVVCR